jgi:hypothetical protein
MDLFTPRCSSSVTKPRKRHSNPSIWPHHKKLLLNSSSPLPFLAQKALGCVIEPARVQEEQYRRLLLKSIESVAFLWKCFLSRKEAWTFYFACYLPSIGFKVPASSSTRSQFKKLQSKKDNEEILLGPNSLGGANFYHLYIEQGIGQFTTFLKRVRSQSTTGKLFQIALSWFQLAVGVSFPISEIHVFPHLVSWWLASLHIFLASQNAFIHPPLQGMHDEHIVDAILQSNW